jgi:cation diffusion facilitator family transporter
VARKEDTSTGRQLNLTDAQRRRIISTSSIIGIVGNLFLSLLKIIIGFISGSFALIGDGVDSMTDVFTSAVTLFTSEISNRPPDWEHPFGHGRAETIATKVLSFIIFFAGGQLALTAIRFIMSGEQREVPSSLAFVAIGISIVGKLLLMLNKHAAGKKANSAMLIADAKNMRNDIFISLSVLIGVFFTIFLNMPILDSITTLLVSAWIIKTAYSIFSETSVELMDGMKDPGYYQKMFDIVRDVSGVVHPHKARIRKINNMYIIDMEIEVDGSLTVCQGHDISIRAEQAIREGMDDIYDVNIHIEPVGNTERQDVFGVTEDILPKE